MLNQGRCKRRVRTLCRAAPLLCLAMTGSAWAISPQAALPDAPQTQGSQAAQTQKPTTPTQPGDSNYTLQNAEHQRIFGIIPEFQAVNTAVVYKPLTTRQKYSLFWKSSTDPYIFTLDAIVAGIGQAKNSNAGYGQGAQGYFKRYAASYADTFDGNFWGNAVLTSAFHEDPRYFREGESHGYTHRALYSAVTAVWTRHDSGKWGPNYANVLGNIISGGISNLYYPASDRGFGKTFTGAITVTAEGTIGSELEEFWPDLVKYHHHKQLEKQERLTQAAGQHP